MQVDRRMFVAAGLATHLLSSKLLAAQTATGEKYISASVSIEGNRLWTAVSLEGMKPELFILDTGASFSAISASYAKTNKLRTNGQMTVKGLGGADTHEFARIKKMLIGGAFSKDDHVFTVVKNFDRAGFVGTLGSEFLTFADSDLDFVKSEWRIYPEGRKDRVGFYALPDSYDDTSQIPKLSMPVKIGLFQGRFMVDTGAPGSLLIDGNAAEKSGIWNSGAPYAPDLTRGFGSGYSQTRVYRTDRIKIHKFVLEKQLVRCLKPGMDRTQIRRFDGLVGMAALRHFHISTDKNGRTLWLAPNGMQFPENEEYPMSGLWLEGEKTNIRIEDVGIGSPAAKAGLMVGDKIIGKEYRSLIDEITGKAGRVIVFDYERGGKRARAEFTLQPYL